VGRSEIEALVVKVPPSAGIAKLNVAVVTPSAGAVCNPFESWVTARRSHPPVEPPARRGRIRGCPAPPGLAC
jgi:hypothetical protein